MGIENLQRLLTDFWEICSLQWQCERRNPSTIVSWASERSWEPWLLLEIHIPSDETILSGFCSNFFLSLWSCLLHNFKKDGGRSECLRLFTKGQIFQISTNNSLSQSHFARNLSKQEWLSWCCLIYLVKRVEATMPGDFFVKMLRISSSLDKAILQKNSKQIKRKEDGEVGKKN